VDLIEAFDKINHNRLVKELEKIINDQRLMNEIRKMLNVKIINLRSSVSTLSLGIYP
jgi:retron-type reverse transcriptase